MWSFDMVDNQFYTAWKEVKHVRPPVKFACEHFNGQSDLVCIEVGVQRGDHAAMIDMILQPQFLYLVDSWEEIDRDGEVYPGEENFRYVEKRFQHRDYIQLYRGRSGDVLPCFEDDFFDFIYIDGGHRMEEVADDIRNAVRLTKVGGVIGGHDFNSNRRRTMGVTKAVMDRFGKDEEFQSSAADWWVLITRKIKDNYRR